MTEGFIKPLCIESIEIINIIRRNNTENTRLGVMQASVFSTNRKWTV